MRLMPSTLSRRVSNVSSVSSDREGRFGCMVNIKGSKSSTKMSDILRNTTVHSVANYRFPKTSLEVFSR